MTVLPSIVRHALFEVAVFAVLAVLLRLSIYDEFSPVGAPLVHSAYATFFLLTPLIVAFFFAGRWRSRSLAVARFVLGVVGAGAVACAAIWGGFLGWVVLTCRGEECIGLVTIPIVGTISLGGTIVLSASIALGVRAAESTGFRPPRSAAIVTGIVSVAFALWVVRDIAR